LSSAASPDARAADPPTGAAWSETAFGTWRPTPTIRGAAPWHLRGGVYCGRSGEL